MKEKLLLETIDNEYTNCENARVGQAEVCRSLCLLRQRGGNRVSWLERVCRSIGCQVAVPYLEVGRDR